MGAAAPGGMTTTLLAVVVMLLALLALRLIGRVLGLVLHLARTGEPHAPRWFMTLRDGSLGHPDRPS